MINFPAMTEEQRQLAALCKIEIKRWQAASESNPNMRYMVELMEMALAALTARPKGFIESKANGTDCFILKGFYLNGLVEGDELYTAPPASVLRVPDEMHHKQSPHGESSLWAMGWNECLAEVKRLNTQPSPPEVSNEQ